MATVSANNPTTTTTQGSTTPINPDPTAVITLGVAAAALLAATQPPVVSMDVSATYNASTTQSQVGLQFGSTQSTNTVSIGESVIDISVINTIRSRSINFSAYHLKPLTNLYAFFDNVNVDNYVFTSTRLVLDKAIPEKYSKEFTLTDSVVTVLFAKGKTAFIRQKFNDPSLITNHTLTAADTFTWGNETYNETYEITAINQDEKLTTDKDGYVAGVFVLPNTDQASFKTGTRSFLLCDSVTNNSAEIHTAAEFSYYASGTTQTKQATTLATRINQVTIDPILKSSTTEVATTVAAPTASSPSNPITITVDSSNPYITAYSPTLGQTGIAVNSNIVFTFSENIVKGGGNIVLKKSNGTVVETFDIATSTRLSFVGNTLTINPTADLFKDVTYYVDIPYDSIRDAVANPYAGSSNYSFTTIPEPVVVGVPTTLSAISFFPSDGATDIDMGTNIKIEFNSGILKGTGTINLYIGATVFEAFDVATSTLLSFVGNTLTINPSQNLSPITKYVVGIPGTAIKSAENNSIFWVGTTQYDFTTPIATTNIVIGKTVERRHSVTDYEIDFSTGLGMCGIDVTQCLGGGPTVEGVESFQLIWDGKIVAGSGGTLEEPSFVTSDVSPFTKIGKRYKGIHNWVTIIPPTKTNPLKYRFNKDKSYPKGALLRVTSWGSNTWNSVLPASTIVTDGRANLNLTPNNTNFAPPKLDGILSMWHLGDKAFYSNTKSQFGLPNNVGGKSIATLQYRGQNNEILYANRGQCLVTFPAGNKTITYTIANNGKGPGTIESVNVNMSQDYSGASAKSPAYNLPFRANITTAISNIVSVSKKVRTNRTAFPITLQVGESVVFNVTVTWPYVFYSPAFDWAAKTGLTQPISYNKLSKLSNYAAIIADYKKTVYEPVKAINTFLLNWEVTPLYAGDPKLDVSSNLKLISNATAIANIDPLAQTFFINPSEHPEGYFVSSIDLYFKKKSFTDDITVQIRPVVNGIPSAVDIVPFATSSLSASQVNTTVYPSTDANSATKFRFSSPIYLSAGTYSIVIISPSIDYELFTATLGNFRLDSLTSRIAEPPYSGDLFKSSNSQTWLPSPYQDLCFVINRCNFVPSGELSFISSKPVSNFELQYNKFIPSTRYNQDSIIRVESAENTDRVYMVTTQGTNGISGTTAPTHTTGTETNGSLSLLFLRTEARWQTIPVAYDVIYQQGENLSFNKTDTKYYYKSTNEAGVTDTNYTGIMKDISYDLPERKVIDSVSKDLFSKIELTTEDDKLSPVIDIFRLSNILVKNLVNSDTIAPNFIASTAITADKYIKVLYGSMYKMYSVIVPGVTSTLAPSFDGNDTLNGSALLRYIGETHNGDTELLPAGGMALSKYITRKVILADGFESTDIVVRFNANTPIGSSIKVYYKAVFVSGNNTLEQSPYYEMSMSERGASFTSQYVEHKFICDYDDVASPGVRFALPNKQLFNQFIIKIVMLSTDTVIVPKIRDLRVIALND